MKLKEILLLILGGIICGYFFFFRFGQKSLSYKFDFMWNSYLFIFYFLLFIIFSFLLLKNLFSNNTNNSKRKFWIFFRKILDQFFLFFLSIYNNALLQIYNFFFFSEYFFPLDPFLYWLCFRLKEILILPQIHNNPKIKLLFYYCIKIMPRLLITIIFSIEIIVFHELYYFYKILFVLILVLFWNLFYFFIEQYCTLSSIILFKFFEISLSNNENGIIIFASRKNNLYTNSMNFSEKEYLQMEKDITMFFIINKLFIIDFGDQSNIKNGIFYKKSIQLIFFLYAISFGYILFRMLLNYFFGY